MGEEADYNYNHDYDNEYNSYDNELTERIVEYKRKANTHLSKIQRAEEARKAAAAHQVRFLSREEAAQLKRGWTETKEILRKQVLEQAAIKRKSILVGYKARDANFNPILGSVSGESIQQVRGWLEAKGLRVDWVFQLHAGESMDQFDDETGWLRHDYEGVLVAAAQNRSLSEAEKFANQWLADKLRALDEKRAAAKELEDVDPAKGYTSNFPIAAKRLLAKLQKPKASASAIASHAGLAGAIGLMGDITANSFYNVPEIGLAGAVLAVGTLAVHGIIRSDRADVEPARRRVIESRFESERASLRQWLQVRYGLSVEPDVLMHLVSTVVEEKVKQTSFQAEDGRHFKFMKVMDDEGWLVFGTTPPASESIAEISAALSRGKAAVANAREVLDRAQPVLAAIQAQQIFTGEVALLHDRIQQMFALLDAQPLNVEEQHVVARAKQDVAAMASTLSALAALGDRESGQKRAADVLGQLVEELNELVVAKKAALLSELDVQRIYVTERRRPVGGRLELIKPQAQLEPLPKSEEVQ